MTLAAATSFMAEVIFLVFFTEPTRSRSSLMDLIGRHMYVQNHGSPLSSPVLTPPSPKKAL